MRESRDMLQPNEKVRLILQPLTLWHDNLKAKALVISRERKEEKPPTA